MQTLPIALSSILELKIDLTDEQFWHLCQNNRDYKFERTASGEVLIMPPTGSETGRRNVKITTQLDIWNSQSNLGEVFDSSTGFQLPNGANRSPDASWVSRARWDNLSSEEKEGFAPICPDFVIELRSRTDSLNSLQEKMQEYIQNGAKLGWLIDRKNRQIEIYRPSQDVEILENPTTISGENILSGFVLDLTYIW
jgi:Uma2 family endonuclease